MKARDMVKKPVKMAQWIDRGDPLITLPLPSPHLRDGSLPPFERFEW
jgi:hypothetical protein